MSDVLSFELIVVLVFSCHWPVPSAPIIAGFDVSTCRSMSSTELSTFGEKEIIGCESTFCIKGQKASLDHRQIFSLHEIIADTVHSTNPRTIKDWPGHLTVHHDAKSQTVNTRFKWYNLIRHAYKSCPARLIKTIPIHTSNLIYCPLSGGTHYHISLP